MTVLEGEIKSNPYYWMRKWKIIIVLEGLETGIDVSDLRVTAHVKKNILCSNQTGEINIYNLNPETEKLILSKGTKVYLEAGYDDGENYGQIFYGDIIQPFRGKENPTDYFLKLVCLADDDFMNWGITGLSARRGTNYRDLVHLIASQSEPALEVGEIPDGWGMNKLSRGLSLFDTTKSVLRGVGRSQNSIITIDNGKINVTSLNTPAQPTEAFVMSSQTGMIGMPTQTFEGVNVTCLLNPRIKLGGWLQINNADIIENQIQVGELFNALDLDGLYRVISQTFRLDTRGNDWYIDNETITQAGMLPVMLQDQAQNGV